MKCKFEHDGDCCNCGASQYMAKCKGVCGSAVAITNADHIRAMSDERMALFLADCQYEDKSPKDILYWLRQPDAK